MKYSKQLWRYRVEGNGFAYKLQGKFTITPYSGPYFAITADGWLLVSGIYGWDGATMFPDFRWMMTASAIHDALHNAILVGAIPESENDLIDEELNLAVRGNMGKQWLLKLRGWYVRAGTQLVDQKAGATAKVHNIPPLQHEISMEEYYKRVGRF